MSSRAGNTTRRSTRASSSRAGSEDAASVLSEGLETPAPRRRTKGTPAKEAVQTGRDIGNRGSAAYGAKGKAYSATKLSAEDAQRDPLDLLGAAVNRAKKKQGPSSHRGASLAPLEEEQTEQRSPSPARDQAPNSGAAPILPTNNPAPTPLTSAPNTPFTVNNAGVAHRNALQRAHFNIKEWFTGGTRPVIVRPEANAELTAQWDSFQDEIITRDRRRNLVFYGMMLISALLLCFLMFSTYFGSLPLGRSLAGIRFNASADANVAQNLLGMNHRLSAVEKIVGRFSDRPRSGESVELPHYQPYRHVDWFAAANGAVVIPYITSPPHFKYCKKAPVHFPRTIKAFMFGASASCAADSGATALKPWTEVDERFCAPPNRGKLQLSVITPRDISPTTLVIEHPKDALIEKGETPKNIELWLDVKDDLIREQLKTSLHYLNSDRSFAYMPQTDREITIDKTLPDTFVLVGRWNFDLYDPRYIQSFDIPVDLQAHGAKANRFAVRVNSNWGDVTATCLFRVRLHGHDQSGLTERLAGPLGV